MKQIYADNEIQFLNEDNVKLAYAKIPFKNEETINVTKVFVDPSLRGGGVASQVMQAVYDFAVAEGLKVMNTCPYAVAWFKRHQDKADVLSDIEANVACEL